MEILFINLPVKGTLALLLIHNIFALIASTIRPFEYSKAMHLVIFPHTVILAPVSPLVPALSFDVVLFEVADVKIAITPNESSRALLVTICVFAFKFRAVRPAFKPLSMLFIVFPEASKIAAIIVHVVAETMSVVIFEFALIEGTI